jgi:hypothetical protein
VKGPAGYKILSNFETGTFRPSMFNSAAPM